MRKVIRFCIWGLVNVINPTFNTTITLYHQHKYIDETTKQTVTEWKRSNHNECYYGTQKAESLNGNTLSQASSYIVRIPYNGTSVEIAEGDIVICGDVADEIKDIQGKRVTDLIQKYKPDCFVVRTCTDNTKILYGAHYKLTGV